MDDLAAAVRAALRRHPAVTAVALAGSRAAGSAHPRSDWDFAVHTTGFGDVAAALPELVAPLEPLAAQWDRYSHTACYMLMLRGPTKVDLIFPDEPQEWAPPWEATAATLQAIDDHFWDWALWLRQKAHGPRPDVLPGELAKLHELLLRPLGATAPPRSVADAVAAYLRARGARERELGTAVSRRLEREVRPALSAEAASLRPDP